MRLGYSLGLMLGLALAGVGCDRLDALKAELLGSSKPAAGEDPELAAVRELYASGQYTAALARAQGLATANPGMTEAHYYRGVSHLALAGEADPRAPLSEAEQAALDAFSSALSINPRHVPSTVAIGDLYSRRVPARRRRGSSEDPEDPYVLARQAYEKAVTLDPRDPEAQRHYAAFLERTGELEAAENAYRAAAESAATIPEEAPDYYVAYGRFLAGPPDRLEEAIEQFELARMFRQDDATIQQEIAVVYSRMGLRHLEKQEYMLAEEALKKADALFPDRSIPEAQKTAEALTELRSIRRR